MKALAVMEEQMNWIRVAMAAVVGFVRNIPELTWFLLLLMGLDTIFGIAAAWKQRKLSPDAARRGATKKVGSLGIIVLAALVDQYIDLLGIDLVQVTTVFYIGPELLSILRNAAILEVPVPPQFAQVLAYFQKDEKNGDADKPVPKNAN